MKIKQCWLAVLAVSVAFSIATPAMGVARKNTAASSMSQAFGQSFENWLRDYWAWSFAGVGSQEHANGVFFMPVPPPTSTVMQGERPIGIGETNLTVKPGTKLVLGVLAWLGESYVDGSVDTPWTVADFVPPKGEAVINLDGVDLINASNVQKFYYGPVQFDPPIMYSEPSSYGSTGVVYVQGIGVVLQPLTPGTHTLTLYSWDAWRGLYGAGGQGWFNTWHITVATPPEIRSTLPSGMNEN